jgi:hypothetical protein
MKTFLSLVSALSLLGLGACSRNEDSAAKGSPTPNPNLQKDAERLQQATANAAKQREQSATGSPTPSPAH